MESMALLSICGRISASGFLRRNRCGVRSAHVWFLLILILEEAYVFPSKDEGRGEGILFVCCGDTNPILS